MSHKQGAIMTAASNDVPAAEKESEIESLKDLITREMAAQRQEMAAQRQEVGDGFHELSKTFADLSSRFDNLARRFEIVELDSGMRTERRRREAGAPPYREQVRPDSETSGDGFNSYPWERKPATPRLS